MVRSLPWQLPAAIAAAILASVAIIAYLMSNPPEGDKPVTQAKADAPSKQSNERTLSKPKEDKPHRPESTPEAKPEVKSEAQPEPEPPQPEIKSEPKPEPNAYPKQLLTTRITIAGKWSWPSGGTTEFKDNGTMAYSGGTSGKWKCVDEKAGKYVTSWSDGGAELLLISSDGTALSIKNFNGATGIAHRL